MLDDLKYIHQRDAQDALGIAEKQWQQLEHNFDLTTTNLEPSEITNIVYAGMGGSALAALIAKSWPNPALPFEVCRQYNAPNYVGPKTLFIAASYSGNTEETLSALAQAEQKGAQIFVITGGGKLHEIAETKDYPLLILPKVEQPRYAALFNLKAIVVVLQATGIIKNQDSELSSASEFLKESVKDWLPTVPSNSNPAKKLAMELSGKSVAIYGGPLLSPIAYKWKINVNENAKNVAWWNELPEFDHNELTGWSSHPVQKPYAIVDLMSELEHERVTRRFEVGAKLLSGRRPEPHTIRAKGGTLLQQLVWSMAFGDFVTIYLGLLNGVNPTPVDLVEKFKKELG